MSVVCPLDVRCPARALSPEDSWPVATPCATDPPSPFNKHCLIMAPPRHRPAANHRKTFPIFAGSSAAATACRSTACRLRQKVFAESWETARRPDAYPECYEKPFHLHPAVPQGTQHPQRLRALHHHAMHPRGSQDLLVGLWRQCSRRIRRLTSSEPASTPDHEPHTQPSRAPASLRMHDAHLCFDHP